MRQATSVAATGQTTKMFPHARGYPLVGSLPRMVRDPLGFFVQVAHEHDGLVRFELGRRPMYLVTDPAAVKHILQDNYRNYIKGYDVVEALLGTGLVTSEGELWLRQRRLMQPQFHRQRIATLLEPMATATSALLERWQLAAHQGQPLDVAAEMMGLTQRIIVATMFSTDIGTAGKAVGRAFATALEHLNRQLFSPILIPERVPTPGNRRFRRAIELLDDVVYRIIAERRAQARTEPDLLSMLLEAEDADTGERMTAKQVRDEIMTIFLAGHETTATVLAWTCYLLSLHPDVERKLAAEFEAVLGGRVPSLNDFPQLTYSRMVLDEVLRLYPPAWMFGRKAIAADEVNGYTIPAKASIALSPYVTHRSPQFWQNPEGFDPERFASAEPQTAQAKATAERPRFAYYPFAGGPRICIGNTFAMMEAQLILAMTYQAFRLALVPGRTVRPRASSTLRPHPHVWMTIHLR